MAKGLVLSLEAVTPFSSGQSGIYLDTTGSGSLIVKVTGQPIQNVTAAIAGGAPAAATVATLYNATGLAIPAFHPISSNASGQMASVNVSDLVSVHMACGITNSVINNLAAGAATTSGVIVNITGLILGAPVFVSKNGGLTQNYPTAGIDSFVSGDYCIKVGIPIKNKDNPANIDLIVNINLVGQIP